MKALNSLLLGICVIWSTFAYANEQDSYLLFVEKAIVVHDTPEKVWSQLSKLDDLTWFPGVEKAEIEGDLKEGVGAIRKVHLLDNAGVLEEKVLDWRPNQELAMRIVSGLPFQDYQVDFKVLPFREKQTVVLIVGYGVSLPMPEESFNVFKDHVSGLYEQALEQLKDKVELEDAVALKQEYKKIQQEAKALAGRPGDISQRAMLLHSIYRDSGENYLFPLVALHGALWAKEFFNVTGPLSDLITSFSTWSEQERAHRYMKLEAFCEALKDTNRHVFIDTYTNYYFSKKFGHLPGAKQIINPELLNALNRVHEANRKNQQLTPGEKKQTFLKALLWEQESTVSAMVKAAMEKLDCEHLKHWVITKPVVRFAYFPIFKFFFFSDFSSQEERIYYATKAYDIGAEVGWETVEESMDAYDVLPEKFFDDPETCVGLLKARLLHSEDDELLDSDDELKAG
ncbi:MAG: SRPBCC family protein [Bacteriovoracia bacterium]